MTQRIEDLDDVKAWIAEHDGRIEAWWEEQRRTNDLMATAMKECVQRISAIERRVMWMSGAAAALGALGGTILPQLFGGLTR